MKKAALVIILICTASASGINALELEFDNSQQNLVLQYNDNFTLMNSGYLNIRYRGTPAPYFMTVSPGYSNDPENRRMRFRWWILTLGWLNYNMYGPSNLTRPLSDLSHSGDDSKFITGYAQATSQWQSKSLKFHTLLPHNQLPPSYTYTDQLTLNLYEGTPDSYTLRDSMTLNISCSVEQIVSCFFVPSGAGTLFPLQDMELQFRDMETGDTRSCDIIVKSNDRFSLALQSANQGRLVHDESAASVSYSLFFDGSSVNLAGGSTNVLTFWDGATAVNGDRYPVNIQLNTVSATLPSGIYRDNITMTITSY